MAYSSMHDMGQKQCFGSAWWQSHFLSFSCVLFLGGGGIAVVGNFASGTCSKCMPFLHAAAREECILSTCRSLLYTSQYFLHDSLECTYIWPGCCIVQMAPPRIHILYKPSKWLKAPLAWGTSTCCHCWLSRHTHGLESWNMQRSLWGQSLIICSKPKHLYGTLKFLWKASVHCDLVPCTPQLLMSSSTLWVGPTRIFCLAFWWRLLFLYGDRVNCLLDTSRSDVSCSSRSSLTP